MKNLITTFVGMATLVAAVGANAQSYPTKTIQIVVPFPAGAISDTVARIVAQKISPILGQPVIVENKGGVAGMVGANSVAKARPDGYTIMLGSNSTNAINKSLYKNVPYDLTTDFAPISMAGEIPAVMIVRPAMGVNDLQGFIKVAKESRGKLNFAAGNATGQVSGETLKSLAGIDMTHVPYKGEPLGLNDLLAGQVDAMFLNLPVAVPHIKTGKVVAVALTGPVRIGALPNVPLASETLKGYTVPNGWLAFFAPAGTPQPIIDRLNKEIVAALNDPTVKERLQATGGYIVSSSTPSELGKRVQQDTDRWAELIRHANIPLQ